LLAAGFFVRLNGFFVAAEFALVKTRRERLNVLVGIHWLRFERDAAKLDDGTK
jgi:CBS domain containing-hemolysin-like protein